MECVTTIRYSVHFNNVNLEPFCPTRGLRQGDPLSPYLFLFIADGLSKLLQQEVDRGALKELHVSRRGLGISLLLFADDTLLFMKASEEHTIIVRNTLQCYERCTGQLINPSKCSILLFGAATDQEARDCVMSILQVSNITTEDKYLGLPMPQGRMTKEKYKSIKEKLIKRFSN
jgi:hypothetical protein